MSHKKEKKKDTVKVEKKEEKIEAIEVKEVKASKSSSKRKSIFVYPVLFSSGMSDLEVDFKVSKFLELQYGIFTLLTVGLNPAVTNGTIGDYLNSISAEDVDDISYTLKPYRPSDVKTWYDMFSEENKDYYVSIIKDKGNRVYYGIYDKEYNDIVIDKYNYMDVFTSDISKLNGNIVFISDDDIDNIETVKPKLDIIKLLEYYKDKEIDAHFLKPNYLKKIEVEEKL